MRVIIGLLIAACVAISLTPAAHAQTQNSEWVYVDTDPSIGKLYARRADLNAGRSTSRAAKLWLLVKKTDGSTLKSLSVVNCPAETYQDIAFISHRPNGSMESQWQGDFKVKFITPGTNMAMIAALLCSDPETFNHS